MEKVAGTRADDGRRWHLYAVPVTTDEQTVWFQAWRLGFEPSQEVAFNNESKEYSQDLA